MKTTIVNKHHKDPKTSNDVYIGRGSDWGNPFSHLAIEGVIRCYTRDGACDRHLEWIFTQRHLLARLKELKGKRLVCYCHPARCHGHTLAQLADTTWWIDGKIVLECSTKGDIRFSAFGATVGIFGREDTIEGHYQLAKRFIQYNGSVVYPDLFIPESIYDVKGKNAKARNMEMFCIVVNGHSFPPEFREEFYKLLWIKYLDEHPELVDYARYFDDYNDIFKGNSIICQADCIRQYIQRGRETMVADVKDFSYMAGGNIA